MEPKYYDNSYKLDILELALRGLFQKRQCGNCSYVEGLLKLIKELQEDAREYAREYRKFAENEPFHESFKEISEGLD